MMLSDGNDKDNNSNKNNDSNKAINITTTTTTNRNKSQPSNQPNPSKQTARIQRYLDEFQTPVVHGDPILLVAVLLSGDQPIVDFEDELTS